MITLKIDTRKVDAKLSNAKKSIAPLMAKELNRFAINTVNDAKRLTPVDEGFLRNAISFNPASEGKLLTEVVVAANYAAYIEWGTKQFSAAYIATLPSDWQAYAATFKGKSGGSYADFILRITDWVKRKGIATGKDINQAAYLIAKKILRDGIPAKPFLYPSVIKNFAELKKRLNS